MLGEVLKQIIKEFPFTEEERKNKPFKDNPIANYMREQASDELNDIINDSYDSKDYKTHFSPGISQWTHGPWGAILCKKISNTYQKGFYVGYAFINGGKGICLNLGQAFTEIEQDKEIKDNIVELESRASFLREKIKKIPEGFLNPQIDTKNRNREYSGSGHIIDKFYSIEDLNNEKMLGDDLKAIMDVYNELIPIYKQKFRLKEIPQERFVLDNNPELKNQIPVSEEESSLYQNNKTRIWKISPGNLEERKIFWPLYKENGFIGIGWFHSDRDYTDFKTVDEIKEALSKYYERYIETNPAFAAYMIWNFTNKIKVGDWVIANGSKKKIYGIGIVKSDYIGPYSDENPHLFDYFEHIRKVDWVITEELEFIQELFDQKTVTEIKEDKWQQIKEEYINKFPQYEEVFNNTPIENEDYPVVSLKFTDIITKLKINSRILKQVCAALNSGKHIILTGAPGTGKTELAIDLCKAVEKLRFSSGIILTTATSDWTTFDTIGGYLPDNDAKLKFEDGIFLKAIKDDNWLIIDEINRADIDKAFGQLFTVLSGQAVELPFLNENRERIKIFPRSSEVSESDSAYSVSDNWRIIATMNVYDKDYLFDMSYAFLRRFSLIEIELPDKKVYEQLITEKGEEYGLEEGDTDLIVKLLDINPIRKIGPAIYLDMVKYVAHRKGIEDTWSDIVEEAFLFFMLPQFEGIDSHNIQKIWNILPEDLQTENTRLKLQDFTLDELK